MLESAAEAGRTHLLAGRWSEARAAFEAALSDSPSAEVLHGLAEAHWWAGDMSESIALYQRAYNQHRNEGNPYGAAGAAITLCITYKNCLGNDAAADGWLSRAESAVASVDATPVQGWILALRGYLLTEHDLDGAEALIRQALEHALRIGDRDLELVTRADLGVVLAKQGHTQDGMRLIDESMAGLSAGENSRLETVVFVCCIMLTACEMLADIERAHHWAHVTDQFLATYGCPFLFAECRALYGGTLVGAGRWAEAERELRSAIKLTAETYPPVHAMALASLADLKLRQGFYEEAESLLAAGEEYLATAFPMASVKLARGEPQVAVALLERVLRGHDRDSIETLRAREIMVEAHLQASEIDAARSALTILLESFESKPWVEAAARCNLASGRVARAEGRMDEALGHFEKAADCFARLELLLEGARARLEIALTAVETAPNLAALEAQAALETFDRLGAAADADRTTGLLRKLGVASRPGPRNMGLLTARETEVLRLLSLGLSNPEIAERLVISRKTVAHHVSNLLSKLGARNRAEAVAYAGRLTKPE
jgi:ATP/maltotriose-dependent transcriptional regulator MalT